MSFPVVPHDDRAPVTRREVGRSMVGGTLLAGLGLPEHAAAVSSPPNPAMDGVVSLKAFGAAGDGRRDDTAEIISAVRYCAATGRTLYISAGTYVITASIIIDSAIGFTILGDGYASCIRPKAGGSYIPILVQRAGFAATSGMHLRNFRLDANGAGQLDTGVITFNDVIGGSISQMWLENGTRRSGSSGQNGISCSAGDVGGAEPEIIVTGNVIRHFSKAAINFTSGGARAVITANFISDIGGNGTAPGIQINGGRNAIVAHNHVSRTEGAGIYVATDKLVNASTNANISHNIVDRCGRSSATQGDGILVTSAERSSGYIIVAGNQLYENGTPGNGGCGIRIENCDNATISGNSCHHNSFDGIRVDNSGFLQITGNHCADNNVARVEFAGGIQLRGKGTQISITGNHLASTGDTQSYAIIADAGADLSFVTMSGNHVTGNMRGTVYWQARGAGLDIDIAVQHRTSGGAPTAVLLWRIDPMAACRITVTIAGRGMDAAQVAIYDRDTLYRYKEGTVVQQDVGRSNGPLANPEWGGVSFASSRGFAVIQVTGAPSKDVEWNGSARIRSI